MNRMNRESTFLSEIELDGLLANAPLPADRGFSGRIEIHVAQELRKARRVLLAVCAAWVLISSAVLFKFLPSVLHLVKSVSFDISLLSIADLSGLAMSSINPLFVATALVPVVFFTIVKITD